LLNIINNSRKRGQNHHFSDTLVINFQLFGRSYVEILPVAIFTRATSHYAYEEYFDHKEGHGNMKNGSEPVIPKKREWKITTT